MISPAQALANPYEAEAFNQRWFPYSGFHDDHRDKVNTPDYMPAIQQVRAEFMALVEIVQKHGTKNMLQLGLGTTAASHELWRKVFKEVVTIDIQVCLTGDIIDAGKIHTGLNTHRFEAIKFAERFQPYDFLFIDAGHTYDDVRMDFRNYARMVRVGGIIALHHMKEVGPWQFIQQQQSTGGGPWNMIGNEFGVAWMVRP